MLADAMLKSLREPYSLDTRPDAQRFLNSVIREMPEKRRAERFFEVNRFVREQGIAGHMMRDPLLTRREAFLKVVRENLGDELFVKVYGQRDD